MEEKTINKKKTKIESFPGKRGKMNRKEKDHNLYKELGMDEYE